ncbi:hypothetical protein IKL64_04780 [bacterium]|nr:hypothetical protein [bacterium]
MKFKKSDAITPCQTMLILGVVFLALLAIFGAPLYNTCKQKMAIAKLRTLYSQLVDASYRHFTSSMTNMNEFDTTLPVDKFAQTYFTSQLPVEEYCTDSQDACWNSKQFVDLQKNAISDKISYSVILKGGTVLGFTKSKENQITLIADIDGKLGDNKLGRDIFVFYIYNNDQRPNICEDTEYEKYYITNGLHFGGFDKCGIPHDVYSYLELFGENLEDGCNKKAPKNPIGVGVGAACSALIKTADWTIDKIYPW